MPQRERREPPVGEAVPQDAGPGRAERRPDPWLRQLEAGEQMALRQGTGRRQGTERRRGYRQQPYHLEGRTRRPRAVTGLRLEQRQAHLGHGRARLPGRIPQRDQQGEGLQRELYRQQGHQHGLLAPDFGILPD